MKICWRSDLLVPSVVLLSLIAVQPIHAADLSEHLRPQGTAAQQVHDPTPTASGAVEASPDMSQPSKAPTHMPSTDAFAEDEASDEAALGVCLGLGLLLAVGLSAVVVLRYSDPTQNPPACVALVTLGVGCAAGLMALFPTDVGAALDDSTGAANLSTTFKPILRLLYRIFYWTAMFLNYLALPSMELLLRSGGFGFLAKLRDSLVAIAKLIAKVVVVSLVGTLLFCAIEDAWNDGDFLGQLESAAIALSNTMGLVQITWLLGFGLVALPRGVWQQANLERALIRCRRGALAEYRARDDAKTQLGMALDDCYRYRARIEASPGHLSHKRATLLASIEEILKDTFGIDSFDEGWSEEEHRRSANRAASQPNAFQVIENTDSKATKGGGSVRAPEAPELVAFRARVLVLRRTYAAAEARVIRCEEQCWTWEDILAYQQQHLGDAAGSSVFSSLQTSSSASLMSSSSSSSANAALRSPLLNYSDNDDHPNEAMTSSSSNMSDLLGGAGTSTSSGAAVNSPNIVWWDGTVSGPWATAWHTKWQQRAMKATAVFFGIGSFLVVLVELASLVDASTAASNGYGAIDGIGVEWFGGPTGCTVMVGVALLHVIATLTWATCAFAGARDYLVTPGRATSVLALSYYARTALTSAAALLFYALELLFPGLPRRGGGGPGAETAFWDVYGDRVVLNALASNFAIFFPAALLVLVGLQAAGCFGYVANKMGMPLSETYGGSTSSSNNFDQDSELQRGTNRLATRRRHVTSAIAAQSRFEALLRPTDQTATASTAHSLLHVPLHDDDDDEDGGAGLRGSVRPHSMESTPSVDGVALSSYDFSTPAPLPTTTRSISGGRRGSTLGAMRRGSTRFGGNTASAGGRRPSSLGHHHLNGSGDDDDDDDHDVCGGIFSYKPSAPGTRPASVDSHQKKSAAEETPCNSSRSKSPPPTRGNSPPPRPSSQPVAQSSPPTAAPPASSHILPPSDTNATSANVTSKPSERAESALTAPSVVVKTVARYLQQPCRRCGVVLPREMHAIEAHDDICAGYNEAEEEEPDLRSAVVDYSHDEPPDALQADDVTIADAFVCPMCFEAFLDQAAVLEHFQSSNCGSGDGNSSGASGGGGARDESSNVSKTVKGRHMAGVTMNGTRPGMDLKGWAEKHNNVKGWQLRWFALHREKGQLQYFKAKKGKKSSNTQPAKGDLEIKGAIDLRFVDSISMTEGNARRVDLVAGPERTYKLRFETDVEGKHWHEQLSVWKEHFGS